MSAKVKFLDNSKCIRCNCFLRKTAGTKTVIKSDAEVKILTNIRNKTVSIGDKLCMKCKRRTRVPLRKKSNIDKVESPLEEETGPSGYREDIISERASLSSSDNESLIDDLEMDPTFVVSIL